MYHSITINGINTWDDWHLIPSARPVVSQPEANLKFVEIPGSDGSVDLSDALTGHPTFKNRPGSWQFIVMHEYWPDWTVTYSTILNAIHGKRATVILEDDPGFYYEGRLTVAGWNTGAQYSKITISYTLDPYKRAITSTSEDWLWDVLDFYDGVIYDKLTDVQVDGQKTITIIGIGQQRVIPTITCSQAMSVNVNGLRSFQLSEGENRNPRIKIVPGENTLVFTGTGTVTVDYRGGVL